MDLILSQLADSVSTAKSLEELTRPMLEMLEAVTGLESTYLTSIDLELGVQHIVFARNTRKLQIPEGLSVPWGDTLCKRALDEDRMFTDNVSECWGDSQAAAALGIATYVSTAVRTDRGVLYGTLCAASSERAPLTDDARRILAMFSRMIGQHVDREAMLVELQAAYAAMEAAALTDTLTGLANRRRLIEELERMQASTRRSGQALIVAFVDLDGFKRINDEFGHDAGDELLVQFARRIKASSRTEDLVARLGGDEFVVAAISAREGAGRTASLIEARLRTAAAEPVHFGQASLPGCGASVGALVVGSETATPHAIIKAADALMYEAKRGRA